MMLFSPGIAQGCYELLTLIKKHQHSASHILNSFPYLGSISSDKIFAFAQKLCWVRVDENNILVPTIAGERILATCSYAHLLRQMLLDYIDVEHPSWMQNAAYGRAKVLNFVGSEIAQIFVEANLASGKDEQTILFWDTLAARARGLSNEHLTEIGRIGERLSLVYEKQRTKREAKWIAIESNEDGYDILSVIDQEDSRKLTIEVKASTMGLQGSFHLTANEWERAQETQHHLFHLWSISSTPACLSVVTVDDMRPHIPSNNGNGNWERIRVPFSAFKKKFIAVGI